MIRYDAKFIVFDSLHVRVPGGLHQYEKFWCSLNTKMNLIMCRVAYFGDDLMMLQNRWYKGVIELPYGEKFMPVSKTSDEFQEPILLNTIYELGKESRRPPHHRLAHRTQRNPHPHHPPKRQ